MQRAFAHYLTREMAVLGLVEAMLSFTAIYVAITVAASASLPGLIDTLPHDSLALAAILTLIPCATGLAIGLYRADAYRDRKRLFVTMGLVAGVAFAILLTVSQALH